MKIGPINNAQDFVISLECSNNDGSLSNSKVKLSLEEFVEGIKNYIESDDNKLVIETPMFQIIESSGDHLLFYNKRSGIGRRISDRHLKQVFIIAGNKEV